MKKSILLFEILTLLISFKSYSQLAVNCVTDCYRTIKYECQTQYSDYDLDVVPPLFYVTGLQNGVTYDIYTYHTNAFGGVWQTEYIPFNFEKSGNYWKWTHSQTSDSVYFNIQGYYQYWVVGARDIIRYSIKVAGGPPGPWKGAEISIVDPMSISGSDGDVFCSNPVSFTLDNMPTSYTSATWQIKQGSAIKSSGSGITATANNLSNGDGQVIFNVTFTCHLNPRTYTRNFHFGPYSSSDYPISGPSSAGCNTDVYYSIPTLRGITSINWVWPSGWTYVSGQNSQYLALRTGTYSGNVMVGVNNICGQSGSYASKFTSVSCYKMVLAPNPTSDLLNVKIINEQSINIADSLNITETPDIDNSSTYLVTIQNKMGSVLYSENKFSNNFTLYVGNLKDGNYVLTVRFNGITISAPFIKSN
jgi:flagellin-like hook-associated protein FlgL